MSTAIEGSPWATRVEAGAQQVRRFSQRRDTENDGATPLPPLVRPHREYTPPPLEETLLSSGSHRAIPLTRPRASTAEVERQAADNVPSVSTLNREFDRLSLAYAGMREATQEVPISAATHCAGRTPRRTSAPAAQRPSLLQRIHPDAAANSPTVSNTQVTASPRVSEVPALPLLRRPSLSVPSEPPLPQVSNLFRRRDSGAPAERSEVKSRPSLPSLSSVSLSTAEAADEPLHAEAQVFGEGPQSAQQHSTPAEAKSPAADVIETPTLADAVTPLPQRVRGQSVSETKTASPTPQGRGKGRDGRIRVVVRKRPLASEETGPDCVQVNGPHVRVAVTKQRVDLSSYEENNDYTFDLAYDSAASNSEVYTTSVADLLTVSLAGGSASCFAYGQTGSGKTHTMMGSDTEGGLYLLAAGDLFGRLGPSQQLCVCFYEIYCNSLFDLLNRRHPIVLREDANRRVNLCGVVWRTVSSVDELWQLMRTGMEQRRTGCTSANEHSSRSHAILSIRIKDAAHLDFMGIINFVDLAGSERAADTAAGDRLTRLEGAEINKSLLALKECIRALDEKRKHVPFRGSRLTEVLRDSFTGNSKTVMIATVSPSSHNHEHTNNTLRYAFRVKGLSIATVEPSKARNAPRPYIPVSRSKSNAGQDDKSQLSPAPTRDGKRKYVAGRSSEAGSPLKQRHLRKRRHTHKKGTTGSSIEEDSTADTTMMELSSMAEVRARRASQQRRSNVAQRQDISSLLPVQDEASSQRRAHRAVYKAPPTTSLPNNSARSSSSSTLNASARNSVPSLPPLVAVSSSSSPSGGVVMDVAALERRLTHQIMAQLRQDLGRQLEDVLSEKDATIAALRHENESLRKALDRAQREPSHTECTPSPQNAGRRRTSGTVQPPAFYPPSPSILHEQTSSGASLSSASSDVVYRVV